jgi:hypothetical protein
LLDLAVPISDLKSLEGNPRRGDVKAVARSLRRFGQRKPIVVDGKGTVITGNRTLAPKIETGESSAGPGSMSNGFELAREIDAPDTEVASLVREASRSGAISAQFRRTLPRLRSHLP